MSDTVVRKTVVSGLNGLNARAAALLAATAGQFRSDISVQFGEATANGKSIMGLMALGAPNGSVVTLIAEGSDAREAVRTIETMIHYTAA